MKASFLGIVAAALGGCAGREDLEVQPEVPRALTSLWDAHGGAASWRRHDAIRFSYKVTLAPRGVEVVFPEVAFRLDDDRRLWVRPSAGSEPIPLPITAPPGSVWSALEGSSAARSVRDLSAEERLDLEFALRSIRFLLGLPLSASRGRWEFRTLVGPPDVQVPGDIEVAPLTHGAPIAGCILFRDAGSGLLAKVVYGKAFPPPLRDTRLVSFDDPVSVGGMTLARRRTHSMIERGTRSVEPPLVFSSAPRAPPPAPWSLKEEVTALELLSGEAARAACPLEENSSPEGKQ